MAAGTLVAFRSDPMRWLLVVCALDRHGLIVLVDTTTLEEVRVVAAGSLTEVADGDQARAAVARVVSTLFECRDYRRLALAKRAARSTEAA